MKRELLTLIPKEEKIQVSCFDTDIFAFVVDKPHRGTGPPGFEPRFMLPSVPYADNLS